MAFEFSLDPILRLQSSRERMERLRLIAINAAITRVRAAMAEIDAESCRSRERLQLALAQGVMNIEVQLETISANARAEQKRVLERKLVELSRRQARQRAIYQQVKQKCEVLANLRSRRLAEYRIEESRQEQRALDEIYLLRRVNPPDEIISMSNPCRGD